MLKLTLLANIELAIISKNSAAIYAIAIDMVLICSGMFSLRDRNVLFYANRFLSMISYQFSVNAVINGRCVQMVCLRDNVFHFFGDKHCTLSRDEINEYVFCCLLVVTVVCLVICVCCYCSELCSKSDI